MTSDDPLQKTRVLSRLSALPLARSKPAAGYLAAIAFSLTALVLRWEVDSLLPAGFPFVTFFPAVIASAFLFGLRPAILAALLCGFFARYLFIAPLHTLTLTNGAAMAMALYAFVVIVDIALVELMQRALRQLDAERERSRRLADHREVLFRELQHRIGNNLQMVGSLLSLQKRQVTDPAGRMALDDSARRLQLIGRIQRKLYDPVTDQMGLGSFLRDLTRDVVDSSGSGIGFEVEGGEGLRLSPDTAIPLGLIVAETVSNAIEHGFAGRLAGKIRLAVREECEALVITVENDGHRLPDDFDLAEVNSLGLRLARSLAQSRGGSFAIGNGGLGTAATLVIPAGSVVRD